MNRASLYGLAALILLLDQASKAWLRAAIPLGGSVALIPGIFEINHTRNTGAAFSLFPGSTLLLAGAAVVVIVILVLVAQRRVGSRVPISLALALALPLGGAVGNLIDRLRLGYVTDMFYFKPINFPVFNVADIAITLGIAILMWRTLFPGEETEGREGDAVAARPL